MSTPMHADEIPIDAALVRRLLAEQFPHWADRPLTPVASSGTINALLRLGDDLVVRLPRVAWGADGVEHEHRWLPRLAPRLPVAIPRLLGAGQPSPAYPYFWSVFGWIEGEIADPDRVDDRVGADVAGFIAALQRVDPTGVNDAYRAGDMPSRDASVRRALDQLHGMIDTDAALAIWESACRVKPWSRPPVWLHSDLLPGNLLVRDGRLAAVIDFAASGIGDPAADLMVAWNLLPAPARPAFRQALAVDDDTWARGRGWALLLALNALPYYQHTNPVMADNARHTIAQILAEG